MASIEWIIAEDGTVSMKVDGVKGGSCLRLTREMQRNLGQTADDVKTAEFYAKETEEETEKERTRQTE